MKRASMRCSNPSATPVGAAGRLAAFAFQSIVGLLDYLFTRWEAQRDGVITAEEAEDLEWARLGIIGLDSLQIIIAGVRLGMLLRDLLIYLAKGAIQLVEELPSRVKPSHSHIGCRKKQFLFHSGSGFLLPLLFRSGLSTYPWHL